VRADGRLTSEIAVRALDSLRIDELGLTELDRKLMRIVIDHGPVGLNSLSAQLGEEPDAIEVCESFLMQIGFLSRTQNGRIATERAIRYFKGSFTRDSGGNEHEQMAEFLVPQGPVD